MLDQGKAQASPAGVGISRRPILLSRVTRPKFTFFLILDLIEYEILTLTSSSAIWFSLRLQSSVLVLLVTWSFSQQQGELAPIDKLGGPYPSAAYLVRISMAGISSYFNWFLNQLGAFWSDKYLGIFVIDKICTSGAQPCPGGLS